MGTRVGVKNKRTAEFDAIYDGYVEKYGDPVEILFALAGSKTEQSTVRATAAKEVIKYRWAAKKAVEIKGQVDVTGTWTDTLRDFDAAEPEPLEFPESE